MARTPAFETAAFVVAAQVLRRFDLGALLPPANHSRRGPLGVGTILESHELLALDQLGNRHDLPAFDAVRRKTDKDPEAREILIKADGGGDYESRPRLHMLELQNFADETGLDVTVCHIPPRTSKWNKIEHRTFSQITQNGRGRPIVSREVIVNLIAGTTTETGLHIEAGLDLAGYLTGIRVTANQMKTVDLCRAEFHGDDWNHTVLPHNNPIE